MNDEMEITCIKVEAVVSTVTTVGAKVNHETPDYCSRSVINYSNPGPPKHKAGNVTLCSVMIIFHS